MSGARRMTGEGVQARRVGTWRRVARLAAWGLVVLVLVGAVTAVGDAAGLGQPQDEFVPMDQVPPEDRLPAAPLLVGAYAIVWLLVFGYLWTIWQRMATVERELTELSRRTEE